EFGRASGGSRARGGRRDADAGHRGGERVRRADIVVLDPPRAGAGREGVDQIARRAGRQIAYLSCDPAPPAPRPGHFGQRGGERVRRADIVVLDPPRAGAGREVVDQIARLAGRKIAYVSCDPATLARDLGYFGERGWTLETLRAFDAFPMTHHVECLATL